MKSGLELIRGLVVEGGVSAVGVIVGFDVSKELDAGVGSVEKASALEHLRFECADERFGPGIVVGIGSRRHALERTRFSEVSTEESAAILTSPIAVEDETGLRAARLIPLSKGISHEIGTEVVGEGPSDDAAGTQVDNHGEVEPAGRSRNEGDVTCPDGVGCGRKACLEEKIRRRFIGFAVAGSWHVGSRLDCFETPLGHETAYPGVTAGNAIFEEILVNSPVTIAAAVMSKDPFDSLSDVPVGEFRHCGRGRVVVAAPGKLQHFADRANAVSSIEVDPGYHFAELCGLLVPRIIAAFFKMSFSMRSWAFSRRSARKSSAPERSPTARIPSLPTCVSRFHR